MTEAEWNEIVLQNLHNHNAEEQNKKKKLAMQREMMRLELQEQVTKK